MYLKFIQFTVIYFLMSNIMMCALISSLIHELYLSIFQQQGPLSLAHSVLSFPWIIQRGTFSIFIFIPLYQYWYNKKSKTSLATSLLLILSSHMYPQACVSIEHYFLIQLCMIIYQKKKRITLVNSFNCSMIWQRAFF